MKYLGNCAALCLTSGLLAVVDGLSVTSVNYSPLEVLIDSEAMKIAVIRVQFDEDIYMPSLFGGFCNATKYGDHGGYDTYQEQPGLPRYTATQPPSQQNDPNQPRPSGDNFASGMPPPNQSGMPPPNQSGMPPPNQSGMPPPNQSGMPPPNQSGMPPPNQSGMPPPNQSGMPPPNQSGMPPQGTPPPPNQSGGPKGSPTFNANPSGVVPLPIVAETNFGSSTSSSGSSTSGDQSSGFPQYDIDRPGNLTLTDRMSMCNWADMIMGSVSMPNFRPFNISCGGIPIMPDQPQQRSDGKNSGGDGPPAIMFMPCLDNPIKEVYSFFSGLPSSTPAFQSRCMMAVVLDMSQNPADSYVQKFKAGQCKFTVKPFFYSRTKTALGLAVRNTKFEIDSSRIPLTRRFCDQRKLTDLIARFQTELQRIDSISTQQDIYMSQGRFALFTTDSTYLDCQDILDRAIIMGTRNVTMESKGCPHAVRTMPWLLDPCCNPDLGNRMCCVPRSATFTVPAVTGLNYTYIALTCRSTNDYSTVIGTFENYANTRAIIQDPILGCRAATARATNSDGTDLSQFFYTWSEFVGECGYEVYGDAYYRFTQGGGSFGPVQGKECTSDSDCCTTCLKYGDESTGRCAIPWNGGDKCLAQCFSRRLDPDVARHLSRSLGAIANNATDFEVQLAAKASVTTCVGQSSTVGRGGWFMPNWNHCNVDNSNYQCRYIGGIGEFGCPVCQPLARPTIVGGTALNPVYQNEQQLFDDIRKGKYIFLNVNSQPYMTGPEYRDKVFYVPPSQTRCMADTICNYRQYYGYAGPENVCGETGNFCALPLDGIQSFDMTVAGRCEKPIPWELNQRINQMISGDRQTYDFYSQYVRTGCQLINGTFAQTQSGPVCLGSLATTEAQCNAKCFSPQGPRPAPITNICYSPVPSVGYCANGYQYKEFCVIQWADSRQCSQFSGTFGRFPYPEFTRQLTVEQCRRQMCFDQRISSPNNCFSRSISMGLFWNNNLNNGTGLCEAHFNIDTSTSQYASFETMCKNAGMTFYDPTNWVEGRYDTPEKCAGGYCKFDPSLTAAECASKSYCNRSCRRCVPTGNIESMCYHNNQTACPETGGVWGQLKDTNACIHSSTDSIAKCTVFQGAVIASCGSLSRDTCWSKPFGDALQCDWRYANCLNREECEQRGECDDRYQMSMSNSNYGDWDDYDRSILDNPQSSQKVSCVLPGRFSEYGWRDCSEIQNTLGTNRIMYSPLGCLVEVDTSSACTNAGGEVYTPARTRSQCESRKGCCQKRSCRWNGELTNKSPVECQKCNGRVENFFNFNGGQWITGQVQQLTWQPRQTKPINIWTRFPDFNAINDLVRRAIGARVTEIYRSEVLCRFGAMLSYSGTAACYCGVNQIPGSCQSGQAAVPVISEAVDCGTNQTIGQSTGVQVNIDASSFNCSRGTINLEVSSVFTGPQGNSTGSGLSKRSLNSNNNNIVVLEKRTLASANCYAYVINSKRAFVGQVRGNCVVFNPAQVPNNVEICMPLKTTIPWDSTTYTESRVALMTEDATTGNKVFTASAQWTVLSSNDRFCFTTNSRGTFCPVSVKTGFDALTTGAQPVCSAIGEALQAVDVANAQLASGATALRFVVQPSASIIAGSKFTSISVRFVDALGTTVTTAAASVTLTLTSSNGAVIIGDPRVAAVDGVAEFTNIAVDLVGSGYSLVASSSYLTTATSNTFLVTAGTPYALSFKTQPGGVVVSQVMLQSPVVAVTDLYGNVITSSSALIVLTPYISGAVTSFGSGLYIKSAVSGSATFDTLLFGTQGTGLTLVASSSGLQDATSETFGVYPADGYAVKLRFATLPASAAAGLAFATQPAVEALDYNGNRVVSVTGSVQLAIKSGTGTLGASVTGQSLIPFTNGLASFTNIGISKAGKDYNITASATSGGLASAEVNSFAVSGPSQLVFTSQPTGSVNGTWSVSIKITDLDNKVYNATSLRISLSIKPLTGSTRGVLAGITKRFTAAGLVTFSDLSISSVGDQYVLLASDGDNTVSGESAPFNIKSSNENQDNGDEDIEDKINKAINGIADALGLSPMVITIIAAVAGTGVAILIIGGLRSRMKRRSNKGKDVNDS